MQGICGTLVSSSSLELRISDCKEVTLDFTRWLSPIDYFKQLCYQPAEREWVQLRVIPLTPKHTEYDMEEDFTAYVKLAELEIKLHMKREEIFRYSKSVESMSACVLSNIVAKQKNAEQVTDSQLLDLGICFATLEKIQTCLSKQEAEWSKFYYDRRDDCIKEKKSHVLEVHRFTICKNEKGKPVLKTKLCTDRGATKKVYFPLNLIDLTMGVQAKFFYVPHVQKNKDDTYEFEILRKTKDTPHVVQMKAFQKKEVNTQRGIEKKVTIGYAYCNQKTLNDYALTHPIRDVLLALSGALKGLQVIHDLGYIHFDAQAGNMFVNDDQGLIADFGNACPVEGFNTNEYLSNELVYGSRGWNPSIWIMPPEILIHFFSEQWGTIVPEHAIDQRVDMWGVGISLAILILGVKLENTGSWFRSSGIPPHLSFLKAYDPEYRLLRDYENPSDLISLFTGLSVKRPPLPTDASPIDQLIYDMLQADPELRPSAGAAAIRCEEIANNLDK